jgi:hypothetical protein
MSYQLTFPNWDPPVKIGVVEMRLRRLFFDSAPSRPTLIAMIEDGTFAGYQDERNGYWYIFESSFNAYLLRWHQRCQQKLAA